MASDEFEVDAVDMSSYTPPGERSFFKYMAPDTAKSVLTHKTFRYNSPLTFNDPFDTQSGMHFDFDVANFNEKILDRLEKLAKSHIKPDVDITDPWGKVVNIVWEKYSTHGFPREMWNKNTVGTLQPLIDTLLDSQQKYVEHFEKVLPTLRVFCVSEEKDNLLMWAHYAKDHTGIVAEVCSLPKEDNPLSVAQPITYSTSPPSFFTEAEWLEDILLQKRLDFGSLLRRYTQTKSIQWAYEKEWRVWYPAIDKSKEEWVDTPIRKSELAAVYIGCRASVEFENEIRHLMSESFPDSKVYKAFKEKNKYALTYREI